MLIWYIWNIIPVLVILRTIWNQAYRNINKIDIKRKIAIPIYHGRCGNHLFLLNHLPLMPDFASVNQISTDSDNSLSPIRHQAIIRTNAWLLSIGPLGTNFSEILIKIKNFSFMKMQLENIVCEMAAILSRGRWFNNIQFESRTKEWCFSLTINVALHD